MKWPNVSRKRPTSQDRGSNSCRNTSGTLQQRCAGVTRPRGSRDCGKLLPNWSVCSVVSKASACRLKPAVNWPVLRTPLEGHRVRSAAAKTHPDRAKVKVRDRAKAMVARVVEARVRVQAEARVRAKVKA